MDVCVEWLKEFRLIWKLVDRLQILIVVLLTGGFFLIPMATDWLDCWTIGVTGWSVGLLECWTDWLECWTVGLTVWTVGLLDWLVGLLDCLSVRRLIGWFVNFLIGENHDIAAKYKISRYLAISTAATMRRKYARGVTTLWLSLKNRFLCLKLRQQFLRSSKM